MLALQTVVSSAGRAWRGAPPAAISLDADLIRSGSCPDEFEKEKVMDHKSLTHSGRAYGKGTLIN